MTTERRTYWFKFWTGEENDYCVGIACTRETAVWYAAHGFKRVKRDMAIKRLRTHSTPGVDVTVEVTIDGWKAELSRFVVASMLKNGKPLPTKTPELEQAG